MENNNEQQIKVKAPKDYQNGKIYTIRSHQTEDIYIGSTTQPLSKRLAKHRSDYKQWKISNTNYITSYEILQYEDVYIELLESFPCNSKNELERKEGECIRNEPKCINKIIAGRNKKEYYGDNINHILENKKEYYKNNRNNILEQQKQYYVENIDHILDYQKQYRTAHKEEICEQRREHYEQNKEEINNKRTQKKIACVCGSELRLSDKARHLKTKKHIEFEKSKIENENK